MRGSRKSVSVDSPLVEKLMYYAKARNMSLADYMRRLLEEAIAAESHGLYPPKLISERRIQVFLERLGFVLVPVEILEDGSDYKRIEERGEKIGRTIAELYPNPEKVLEEFIAATKIAIPQDNSYISFPFSDAKEKLRVFAIGLARGIGLKVEKRGNIYIFWFASERSASAKEKSSH